MRQILSLIRDSLLMLSNLMEQTASLQREYNLQTLDIQSYLSNKNALDFFKGLASLEPKRLQKALRVIAEIGTITSIQNPLQLGYSDKIALVAKLKGMVRELEQIVGISNIMQIPTDLDQQLVERCRDKDYHDIVMNAFPLLEDRIRVKAGADRPYHADGLINYALNPKTGKIVLSDVEAERAGAYLLFKGALSFLRNPPAHTLTITENRNAGLKVMYLADLLIKLLDKAKNGHII